MKEIYLETKRCSVSNKQFRTVRKSYRLSRIEKISLSRRAFYVWLPIGSGLLAFQYALADLLYTHEMLALTFAVLILTMVTWNLGTIVVQSKALSEIAMIGRFGTLKKVKCALDDALEDNLEDSL